MIVSKMLFTEIKNDKNIGISAELDQKLKERRRRKSEEELVFSFLQISYSRK